MNIAFCYESVLPTRGGCETYIADIARRLLADRHEVHLYACRWDAGALPPELQIHAMPPLSGPRFLRPWRFGRRCLRALADQQHDVTVGFDKTWGQDVLYPQGGLHVASVEHNRRKQRRPLLRGLARCVKWFDLAHWSFCLLERRQYLGPQPPLIVVNSHMVRGHFLRYYHVPPGQLHVVRSSIDPERFPEHDRLRRRQEWRERWHITPQETVGLFAAMNYRLKGLEPLLYAMQHLVTSPAYQGRPPALRLVVAGNPAFGAYERLARRLGVQEFVRFVGHCPEMRNAYFAADFLVHPTFYDPCSLVVLEALACGLPVITTRYNGASELLHSGQEGYVIDDPHEASGLAWCLGQLLDPVRRHACAQAARRTAGQWTFEHHYRQLLDVFTQAVQRKRAA
jgi:UDP-glucose:(heptosyl)LPS alpha-1,3-glucosyltransferase